MQHYSYRCPVWYRHFSVFFLIESLGGSWLVYYYYSCLSLNSNFRVNCMYVVLCCSCPEIFICLAFSRNPLIRLHADFFLLLWSNVWFSWSPVCYCFCHKPLYWHARPQNKTIQSAYDLLFTKRVLNTWKRLPSHVVI